MGDHGLPSIVGDSQRREHVVVPHHDAPRRDRAHRQLLVTGHAELAHDVRVERQIERVSDRRGHGDTSPGQPENDGVDVSIRLEHRGELYASVGAVAESPFHGASSVTYFPTGRQRILMTAAPFTRSPARSASA
jgi:hypothetical protein